MARLTSEQWAAVRKDRESNGTPYRALAEKHGVSDAAISKRAKAEGWVVPGKGSGGEKVSKGKVSKVSKKVSANRPANPRANRKREKEVPVEDLEELPEELIGSAVPLEDADSIDISDDDEEFDDAFQSSTHMRVRTWSLEGEAGDSPLFGIHHRTSEGHPTKYHPDFADLAYKHCLLGATPEQVALLLRVDEQTIYNWMKVHPRFAVAMEEGRGSADANVARSLYKRATGYTHRSVKVFQYQGVPVVVPYVEIVQPDTDAAKFWLKNRQPENWKEKVEFEEQPVIALVDKEARRERIEAALAKAAQVERDMQGRAERLGLVIDGSTGEIDGG